MRAERGMFGPVGFQSHLSRLIAALAADAPKALVAIGSARVSARAAAGTGIDAICPADNTEDACRHRLREPERARELPDGPTPPGNSIIA